MAQKIYRPESSVAPRRAGASRRVRVKRCGKSAPRPWQHGWQAKPRTEQDQIGRRRRRQARQAGRPVRESPGRSLDLASNGEARGMVVIRASAAKAASEGNRIRLTARCDLFFDFMTATCAICGTYETPLARAARRRSRQRRAVAQQPPGQIRPRPAEGREPEFTPPTIREYKPQVAARRAAASGAAREVPGHRHPQPSADADLARRVRPRR